MLVIMTEADWERLGESIGALLRLRHDLAIETLAKQQIRNRINEERRARKG